MAVPSSISHIDEQVATFSIDQQGIDIDMCDTNDSGDSSILGHKRNPRDVYTHHLHHPDHFETKIDANDSIQSDSKFGSPYHEALVHPALFAHSWPETVAIIGGNEEPVLREVLKHLSVEHVTIFDVDEVRMNIFQKSLQSWSDCSGIARSDISCFRDERVHFYTDHSSDWLARSFNDINFEVKSKVTNDEKEINFEYDSNSDDERSDEVYEDYESD